ncbi:MAG TPA: DNA circularization N-terminal domain-containing protein [Sinorhizobium sp.]|nr:DNA circularization N-terminal domain-containing protein [Sinorhizobium sp.]
MRDWARTLRRGRYRGVPFWVDFDDLNGGKRLAIHEYAGGRTSYIEEMGLKTSAFEVTAYLTGDTADAQAAALASACIAPGPGLLILPTVSGALAYVEDFRRAFEKDRLGYMAFGFRAIPTSNSSGAVPGVGDVLSAVAVNFAIAASGLGRLFR